MARLLVISARDNVATALEPLSSGETIEVQGAVVRIREAVPRGHKVSLRDIAKGAPVVKYGSSIGAASADIRAGMHVHTHNLASARGRGDLARASMAMEARIAEPPDTEAIELPVAERR